MSSYDTFAPVTQRLQEEAEAEAAAKRKIERKERKKVKKAQKREKKKLKMEKKLQKLELIKKALEAKTRAGQDISEAMQVLEAQAANEKSSPKESGSDSSSG